MSDPSLPSKRSHEISTTDCHMECDGYLSQSYTQVSQHAPMCSISNEAEDTAIGCDESAPTHSTLELLNKAEFKDSMNWQHVLKPSYMPKDPNRLINLLTTLSESLERRGMSNWAIWTQKLPLFCSMASTNDMVKSSLLTLSAYLWATIDRKKNVQQTIIYFRLSAMKGLQIAVSELSKENCDVILAATILLLWASNERSSWIIFWNGLNSILISMPQIWKQESELVKFLESKQYSQPLDLPFYSSYQFPNKDLSGLTHSINLLQHIRGQVWHNDKYYDPVNKLVKFLEGLHDDIHFLSLDQAFQRVHSIREWLFWLPPTIIRDGTDDTLGLAILSHFFAAGLVLCSLYPEAGCHDLGQLAVSPIEEIGCTLCARNTITPQDPHIQLAMSVVEWPRYIANQYSAHVTESAEVPSLYTQFPWQTYYTNY